MTLAGSTPEAGGPQGRELTSPPGVAASSPSLGSPGGSGSFLGEVAGCTWTGGLGGAPGVGGPAREPLTPAASPAVLTEDGRPCRFPFRYGGRLLHSCTSMGSAHRKWWVLAGSVAAAPPRPGAPQPRSPALPQKAWPAAGSR